MERRRERRSTRDTVPRDRANRPRHASLLTQAPRDAASPPRRAGPSAARDANDAGCTSRTTRQKKKWVTENIVTAVVRERE